MQFHDEQQVVQKHRKKIIRIIDAVCFTVIKLQTLVPKRLTQQRLVDLYKLDSMLK